MILADGSKLGKRNNSIFETLENVDRLITDKQADKRHIELFEAAGIEVVVV